MRTAQFLPGVTDNVAHTARELIVRDYHANPEAPSAEQVSATLAQLDALSEKENERRALEQGALAEFLASKGIAASAPGSAQATPVASPAAKDMGPGGGEK